MTVWRAVKKPGPANKSHAMSGGPLVGEFQEAFSRLLPDFGTNNDRLALAVSGGPDSLALLLLAHTSFPGRIAAATVDHRLRPEARAEAEFVGHICAEHGIPHDILVPAIPIRGSIQSEARKARYNSLHLWMEQKNLDWLATAHHADDQLETLVMRLLRGSGLDGLSAIRSKRGHLVRPLLAFPKQLLIDYIISQGLTPIQDPSNEDHSFDRVRIRGALTHLEGFDISLANQSASALDDSRAAMQWMVDRLAAEHIIISGDECVLHIVDFPREILRRLIIRCIHICDPALSPRGPQIERAIKALNFGNNFMIGDIICSPKKDQPSHWQFAPAPPRGIRNSAAKA